jgi:ribose 5-phosphate isomerase A
MANGQAVEKELVARASLRFIEDGQVVGLGSGSTATCMIQLLGERVKAGLKVVGIPSSIHSRDLAASLGIPLTTFDQCQEIDVAIDGADEFDPGLNLIKGGGGALLREKVVASAARKFIVVADSTKQVPVLGRFPLPMEVIRFAQPLVEKKVAALGARVVLRTFSDGKPFVTDEGNHILDCHFGQIADPPALARKLSDMPGIVEHGLFVGIADVVLVGKNGQVLELHKK